MYHYVRDLKHSRYPEIRGLDLPLFIEQIEYLERHYRFITMNELIESMESGAKLPSKSVLLTFDDAYIDHYTNVFPILNKKKIEGSFYVPVKAITEYKILDVNKIHFILASVADKTTLIKELETLLEKFRHEYNLMDWDYYYKKLAATDRFDSPEIIFIKRLLQVELAEEVRSLITDLLFRKFVSGDEITFSRELYMDTEQIGCMHRNGMHIGAHGDNHFWLGALSKELQEVEISRSTDFLKMIKGDQITDLTMCYPYGSYNQDTIDLLNQYRYRAAFTTRVDISQSDITSRFKLPRLDTNDIPKDRNTQPNEWFYKA